MSTIKLQLRRDNASTWTTNNTQILQGECGFELDTGKLKIGKIVGNLWNDLDYLNVDQSNVLGLTTTLAGKANTHHTHTIADLIATGTASDTTYLRGDGSWSTPSSSGTVDLSNYVTTTTLTTALSGKANTSHTHTLSQITITGTASTDTWLRGDGWNILPIDYGQLQDLGSVNGNVVLNCTSKNIFLMILTGTINLSLSNLPSPPYTALLRVVQFGSGNNIINWDSIFRHPLDTLPVLGSTVGDVDYFILQQFVSGRVDVFKADGPFLL